MQRVAIFAGSFDPIHTGHICVLRTVLTASHSDKIVLLPCATPPYRKPSVPSKDLREMIRLSISGGNNVVLAEEKPVGSDRNIIDAIYRIKKTYGDADYSYIIGADKLAGLLHWSKIKKLFKLCSFIVYPRIGYDGPEIISFAASQGLKAELLNMPEVTVTSAAIRKKLSSFSHVSGLLHLRVERYINLKGLYQTDFSKVVRPRMNQHRFEHTLAVRDLAVDLAFKHHAWMQGAAVASLFHDFTKEMKLNKMQAILKNYDENVSALEIVSNALLHGRVAAILAKNVYGIHNVDILNAIAYHTTGHAEMSLLELCVFVADKAESGRKDYPGLQEIRDVMYKDLSSAALLSMKGTQEWVKEQGYSISSAADAAIQSIELAKK